MSSMEVGLTIGEVATRSGFAPSAIRYYEREGLLSAQRTSGNQRRYRGTCLGDWPSSARPATSGCPWTRSRRPWRCWRSGRAPTEANRARLSRSWRGRLNEQITGLIALREG